MNRYKTIWLVTFITMVLIMISIGGITRLTRSGLSIVEWKPVAGIIPPITEEDWTQQFELYKQTPEYQHVNSHFGLAEYKNIFLWEYLHRVFGRLIFLFTLVPGLWLWRKKVVEGRLVFGLSAMIALQGLVGWLMVKSGLNTLPRVSPYMLSLHYFMALIVLSMAYHQISKARPAIQVSMNSSARLMWKTLGVVLVIQIFYGCLTSGMKAGFAFNTYPLMGDSFLPPAGMSLEPWWLNFLENPITVQWIHRWVGMTAFLMVVTVFFVFRHRTNKKGPFIHLLGITTSQVIFGILTLVMGVPIWLATLHQIIAALIVLGYLNISFRMVETAPSR